MRHTTPVYAPLLEKIRRQVADGSLTPGEMIGTEVEFGREKRISRQSVRAGINKLIAEGLVERRAGKGVFVRQKATRVIEIAVPGLGGLWAGVIRGAQAVTREQGIKLQIFNAQCDFEADLQTVRELAGSGVGGAIIGSWHQSSLNRAVVELHQGGFPVVLIDQRLQDFDVPSVTTDNYRVGYLAGQELVRRGHRRIGHIGYAAGTSLRLRFDGLRDAILDAGLRVDRSLNMDLPLESLKRDSENEAIERSTRQIFDRQDRPTAIFLSREEHAGVVYRVIRTMGLRIPTDVSVIGVGNFEAAEILDPPLATIDLHTEQVGRSAMQLLIKQLTDADAPVEHAVVSPHWVERASVAPPADAIRNH